MALGRKSPNTNLSPGIPRQGSAPSEIESPLEPTLSASVSAAVELHQLVQTIAPVESTAGDQTETIAPGLYLLVEQPQAWPTEPVDGLDETTGDLLRRFGARHDAIVSVIRRPRDEITGTVAPVSRPRVFLSTPAHEGLVVTRTVDDLDELATLDLDTAAEDVQSCRVPTGWQEAEPLTLVTAHGSSTRRLDGPTVASALAAVDPENVWETALTAGPADSVNSISLPGNYVHLNLRPRLVTELLDATWQERLVLDRFAGRAHHCAAVRLAETTLRGRLGADAYAAIVPVSVEETPVATGERDESSINVSRVLTRWRVYPALIGDPALARMTPARASQPTQTWRVVIDCSRLVEAGGTDEHLSVIEIADEDEPGLGAHAWDTTYRTLEHDLLPDPTVVSEIAPLVPGRALDLGCGSGRHALWLAEQGWDVTGVDFSRSGLWRMADEAGHRGLAVRAELADLRVWTPAAAGYDLILVSHVYLNDIFQRTAPWLSPTGRIVVGAASLAAFGQLDKGVFRHGFENRLLVREIGIDGHGGQPRPFRELANGQAIITLVLHERMRCCNQIRPDFLALLFAPCLYVDTHFKITAREKIYAVRPPFKFGCRRRPSPSRGSGRRTGGRRCSARRRAIRDPPGERKTIRGMRSAW